jgi:ribosomal protein S6--L-glutamate ligase
MNCITFNPFRTIGIPNTLYIKPELMYGNKDAILQTDWVLFPEYWQVNALVYGLKSKIFPNVNTFHLGHDKIEMTRALLSVCPEHVPYTEILASTESNVTKVLNDFYFPFIAKEVRNSMGRGVFLIENEKQLLEYAQRNQVLYVQEYLPIERDLRIAYVGDEVLGAYWRIGEENSHLNNVSQGGEISFDNIPTEALQLVAKTAKELGINHAGFDVAVVDGHFYFLEFNVLFGNTGFHQMGVSIEQKIFEYLLKEHSPHRPLTPLTPRPKAS